MNLSASGARSEIAPLAKLSLAASLCGLLGLASFLPAFVTGPAVLFFVFAGPGSAIMLWVPDVAGPLRRALVPVLGLAVAIIVSYLAVLEGIWHPALQLAVLIAATSAGALIASPSRATATVEVRQ